MHTAVVGGGAMGAAIIRGLIARGGLEPADLIAAEVVAERRAALAQDYGIGVTGEADTAVSGASLIILAVKPQNFQDLAPTLRPSLDDSALVISIMAGVTLETLRNGLGTDRVVRVMPNIAAQVGRGASVWTADSGVTSADRNRTRAVLGALGMEVELQDELLIDVATAVHGSGPAYVYLLAEAWIDAAAVQGLDRDMATELVRETIAGSAALWQATRSQPAALREAVTSPGGTTAAALAALEDFDFPAAMRAAIDAATRRARELA
ncbi:MAG: pyrroline-5-carboxylate reductase [Chloroflexi bacterium]|nr:pyrroline-5-carboxylate reductase [Chloroflexota bacterium]